MTKKRQSANDVAETAAGDAPNTTPILTPELTEDEARVVAEYCRVFRAKKGPTLLVLGVDAMRAQLAQRNELAQRAA